MESFERKSQGFIQWMENIKSVRLAEIKHNSKRNLSIFNRMYENGQHK